MSARYHSPEVWAQIKTEYLAGTMSLRELEKKYSVDFTSICRRAKKENWQIVREAIQRDTNERLENMIVDTKVSNTERAVRMTNTLLAKLEDAINTVNRKDVSAMRGITTSLKDLQEMGVFKVVNQDSTDIRVEMGGTEDYAD